MLRDPPPNTGSGWLSVWATRCASVAVVFQAQVEDLRARHRGPDATRSRAG